MMMESLNEDTLKCLVVGDSGVGKTGMIIRYLGAQFQTRHLQSILDPITGELGFRLIVLGLHLIRHLKDVSSILK